MKEGGEPSTEVVVTKQEMPAPPGVVMVAPSTILRNGSRLARILRKHRSSNQLTGDEPQTAVP